ncbi:signal peptidase II [Demequina sp. NBRC 110053]|uniref:signal peptidase II n=1 Tax=Demequina sp. NBRC 110053 TaxID=1570342 RepID=UPI000A06BCBE|nr:signal peptidase II [Demequina sp. NBRC 110053]
MTWRPALWLVALLVVVIDQITKQWALAALEPGEKVEIVGDLLSFQLVFNSGAAFSLGNSTTWILTIVAIVVTVGIIYYGRRAQSTPAVLIFGIGLGGAIGNLIDRLFREPSFGQGHVVDMINYNGWFVGNVADIAIVGAAAAILLMSLLRKPLLAPAPGEGTDERSAEAGSTSSEKPDAVVTDDGVSPAGAAEPDAPAATSASDADRRG